MNASKTILCRMTLLVTVVLTWVPSGASGTTDQTCILVDQEREFDELQSVIESQQFFAAVRHEVRSESEDAATYSPGEHDGFAADTYPDYRIAYLDYLGRSDAGGYVYGMTGSNTNGCTAQATAEYIIRKGTGHDGNIMIMAPDPGPPSLIG